MYYKSDFFVHLSKKERSITLQSPDSWPNVRHFCLNDLEAFWIFVAVPVFPTPVDDAAYFALENVARPCVCSQSEPPSVVR